MKLWKRFSGEPYLVNPHIVSLSLNPKKRGSTMAKKKVSKNRNYARPAKKRSSASKTVILMNKPKKNGSVKRYKGNSPAMRGKIPFLNMSLMELLYAGGGFVAPPLIEGAISNVLPDALKTSKIGKYVTKGAIGLVLSMAVAKFINREAGKFVGIGAGTYLVANLIYDYAPDVFGGFSGMSPAPIQARTLSGHPMLGAYLGAYLGDGMTQDDVPERLKIANRF
jgi:hypothetical protein